MKSGTKAPTVFVGAFVAYPSVIRSPTMSSLMYFIDNIYILSSAHVYKNMLKLLLGRVSQVGG